MAPLLGASPPYRLQTGGYLSPSIALLKHSQHLIGALPVAQWTALVTRSYTARSREAILKPKSSQSLTRCPHL